MGHEHNAVIRQFVESKHRLFLRIFFRATSHTGQHWIQYQSSIILSRMDAEYKTGMVLIPDYFN